MSLNKRIYRALFFQVLLAVKLNNVSFKTVLSDFFFFIDLDLNSSFFSVCKIHILGVFSFCPSGPFQQPSLPQEIPTFLRPSRILLFFRRISPRHTAQLTILQCTHCTAYSTAINTLHSAFFTPLCIVLILLYLTLHTETSTVLYHTHYKVFSQLYCTVHIT